LKIKSNGQTIKLVGVADQVEVVVTNFYPEQILGTQS